jgi:hypothetical protein
MRRAEGGSREGSSPILGLWLLAHSLASTELASAGDLRSPRPIRSKEESCHVTTQRTPFQAGDIRGGLTGKTVAGTPITGTDSVAIVPPT